LQSWCYWRWPCAARPMACSTADPPVAEEPADPVAQERIGRAPGVPEWVAKFLRLHKK
jgi:hypothetical protein